MGSPGVLIQVFELRRQLNVRLNHTLAHDSTTTDSLSLLLVAPMEAIASADAKREHASRRRRPSFLRLVPRDGLWSGMRKGQRRPQETSKEDEEENDGLPWVSNRYKDGSSSGECLSSKDIAHLQ